MCWHKIDSRIYLAKAREAFVVGSWISHRRSQFVKPPFHKIWPHKPPEQFNGSLPWKGHTLAAAHFSQQLSQSCRDLSFASRTNVSDNFMITSHVERLMDYAFAKAKHAVAKDPIVRTLGWRKLAKSVPFAKACESVLAQNAARESQNASRESVAKGTCERRAH